MALTSLQWRMRRSRWIKQDEFGSRCVNIARRKKLFVCLTSQPKSVNQRPAIRSSAWAFPAQYLRESATVNTGEFREGYQAQLEEVAPLTNEHSKLIP
jgi:hypothetical protein